MTNCRSFKEVWSSSDEELPSWQLPSSEAEEVQENQYLGLILINREDLVEVAEILEESDFVNAGDPDIKGNQICALSNSILYCKASRFLYFQNNK